MNPDFLIVGAMKAGTSSLAAYFAQNAYISGPQAIAGMPIKEVSYFSINYELNTVDDYEYLYRFKGPKQKSFEASADYFHTIGVPERIFKHNPITKIIILLRDPVQRAWAHYWHEVNFNHVENEQFLDAIKRPRFTDYDNYHYQYLYIGKYLEHLERWFGVFPAEQIAIVFSHDFFADPDKYFRSLQLWVGLPIVAKLNEYDTYNKGKKGKMSNEIKEFLINYYNPLNERLAEQLKIQNPWRYN